MIELFAERKQGIVATALLSGRQRAANVAAQLSRRGRAQAAAELCNEAVGVLIHLCYEPDTDGNPANIDGATGRLLIPVPWGEKGHKYYGLRSTEQRALRRYMFDLQGSAATVAPLFVYDGPERSWFLNIWDFPNGPVALEYWKRSGISAKRVR